MLAVSIPHLARKSRVWLSSAGRAAAEHRIIITQDRSTMIRFARERIVAGLPMPGLWDL